MKENKYFLDTNILIYGFDNRNHLKQKHAQQLLERGLEENKAAISYQVIQEFLHVSARKFAVPMSIDEQKLFLTTVLLPLCQIYPTGEFYKTAIDLKDRYQFSFYDSLIIAAALEADCQILYTEDLQHHQKILGLKIINPFAD